MYTYPERWYVLDGNYVPNSGVCELGAMAGLGLGQRRWEHVCTTERTIMIRGVP